MIIKFRLSLLRGLCPFVSFSFARKQILYAYCKRTLFFLSASFELCGRLSPHFASIKFLFRTIFAPGTAIGLNQEMLAKRCFGSLYSSYGSRIRNKTQKKTLWFLLNCASEFRPTGVCLNAEI